MKIKLHLILLFILWAFTNIIAQENNPQQNQDNNTTLQGLKLKDGTKINTGTYRANGNVLKGLKLAPLSPTKNVNGLKAIKIQASQKFYLNSYTGDKMGGHSRSYIYLQMPQNVVAWCYSFTTYRNEEEAIKASNSIKIAAELSKALEKTGSASAAIQLVGELVKPTGTVVCDVYLFAPKAKESFMSGNMKYHYYDVGTRLNFNAGTVGINSWGLGNVYLGFENKSLIYGTNVVVEVVAIVREF